jgi:hypothetical protein
MLIVHVEHVATPHPGSGNRPGDAWCERPGGPARKRRGRSSLGAERVQEPEGDRMTAASKYGSPRKLQCGGRSARRTRFPWGEAGVLGQGRDTCSRGARRGMGPSTCTRVAEIMSGRAIAQQGLATTCKDRAHNGHTGGAGRAMVWRMSPYERRRGGNAPPGGLEAAPARVTPAPGKGALGTRWPRQSGTHQTQSWVTRGLHRGERARQTPPWRGEGCASTAVPRRGGRPALRNGVQSRGQNRTREIRPSGIVEGLQETWPVGALISTRRAHLISISTTACTDRWGAGGNRHQSAQPRGARRLSPTRPTSRTVACRRSGIVEAWARRQLTPRPRVKRRLPLGDSGPGRPGCSRSRWGRSLAAAAVCLDDACRQPLRAADPAVMSCSSRADARCAADAALAKRVVRSARVERFSFWKTCVRCVSTVRRVM